MDTANKEIAKLDADIADLIADFKQHLAQTKDFEQIKKSIATLEKEWKTQNSTQNDQNTEGGTLTKIVRAKKQFADIQKPYTALGKDKGILDAKLAKLDGLLAEIGGIITAEEAQILILKKHFDIINNQLQRYLNTEKRTLIGAYENLFDKYFLSAQNIDKQRNTTMKELNDFLTQLKYL